jgi:hypothetical protein
MLDMIGVSPNKYRKLSEKLLKSQKALALSDSVDEELLLGGRN